MQLAFKTDINGKTFWVACDEEGDFTFKDESTGLYWIVRECDTLQDAHELMEEAVC